MDHQNDNLYVHPSIFTVIRHFFTLEKHNAVKLTTKVLTMKLCKVKKYPEYRQ